jgi:hypothetical protein
MPPTFSSSFSAALPSPKQLRRSCSGAELLRKSPLGCHSARIGCRIQKPLGTPADERLEKLGAGEREAIALAMMYFPDVLLLVDETKGRDEARHRQIRFMGTLGVLDKAAARGLLHLPSMLERLLQTTFYVSPTLLKELLADDDRRKRSSSLQP